MWSAMNLLLIAVSPSAIYALEEDAEVRALYIISRS